METRIARLEAKLEALETAVAELERRLAAHGGQPSITGAIPPDSPALSARSVATDGESAAVRDMATPIALLGRTLVIFAGAYLLRALTDSGFWPGAAGVTIGLLYGLVWLVPADRWRGRRLSGFLHGVAASVIAFPLLWEAGTRFGLFGPATSASALAVVTLLGLAVAWHRRLQPLAWIVTLAGLLTASAFIGETRVVTPFAVYFVGLGIACLWLGYQREWVALRWPTALAADLAVVGVTARAVSGQALEPAATALALQLLLFGSYLASIAGRTLVRGRNVVPFEVAQAPAALAVALGGAVAVAGDAGAGRGVLGITSLLLGAVCYGIAFAFVDRRQGRGPNFYFYTSLALVLTLTGSWLVLTPAALPWGWALAAMVAGYVASRVSRLALTLHATVYLVAAASSSGLLALARAALAGPAGPSGPPVLFVHAGVIFAAAVCLLGPRGADERGDLSHAPRLVVGIVLLAGAGGIVIGLLANALAKPAGVVDPGMLATLRTGVLAAAALIVAGAARHRRGTELGWLLYPIMAAGGFKLVVEDLRHSRPSTLFIALALYGLALIAAPRLARGSAR